eukprot:7634544-Pyramimonas_sp.AAC.1
MEERIKALTEEFTEKIETEKANYANAMADKSSVEQQVEERLRQLNVEHRNDLAQLESQFQQKIMGEVERYQVRRR